MTRLESSARDYAIAYISAAPSSTVAMGILPLVVGPAYSRAVEIVAAEENLRVGGIGLHRWPEAMAYARRLVRARVALYLRTLRRMEAWERDRWGWAEFQPDGAVVLNGRVMRDEEIADIHHRYEGGELRGFVPLWTLAPAHRPGVTARMRRGRVEALGREAPGPEVVT